MSDNRTTELLCKLLEERGEDYMRNDFGITWNYYSDPHTATESMDGTLIVTGLAPEQAIAATLGSGMLTAEQVKRIHEIIEKHWHDLPDEYDMPEATALPEYSYDWQAIADELNSRAKPPCEGGYCPLCGAIERTCHIVKNSRKYVLSDGRELFDDGCSICNGYVGDGDNYCSNCGARVVNE